MTAALEKKIAEWSSDLPYWERLALSWIHEGRELADSDYEILTQYLLEEAGLESVAQPRDEVDLS